MCFSNHVFINPRHAVILANSDPLDKYESDSREVNALPTTSSWQSMIAGSPLVLYHTLTNTTAVRWHLARLRPRANAWGSQGRRSMAPEMRDAGYL